MDRPEPLVPTAAAMWLIHLLTLISPIDVIPDLLPLVGLFDDSARTFVAVVFSVYAAARWFARRQKDPLQPEVIDASFTKASRAWEAYEPVSKDDIEAL